MEGVMMRGRKATVTVVRRPNGKLTTNVKSLSHLYTGWLRKTPFIRGIIVLIETMSLGIGSLFYSANVALEEDGEEISHTPTWFILLLSFTLAVVLFFIAPLFLTKLLDPYIESSLLFHLVEGIIRLVIFLIYLKLIGLMPDIKRTFAYHGAEHKTVNAYENGIPLVVKAVQQYGTAHARCGTAFLLVVLVIAVLVFAMVGRQAVWLMVVSRVLLIPVIAAVSYEITQLGARHMNTIIARTVMAPGLWLQSLSTREPDDGQVEVAIVALEKALALDAEETNSQETE
jgi:uncharacterized protein YqhQ